MPLCCSMIVDFMLFVCISIHIYIYILENEAVNNVLLNNYSLGNYLQIYIIQ